MRPLLLLISLFVLTGARCPAPEDAFFSYPDPVRSREVLLFLEPDEIAVSFTEEGVESMEDIVANHPSLIGILGMPPTGFFYLVAVAGGATEAEILAALDDLNRTPGVEWANPLVNLGSLFGTTTFFPGPGARAAVMDRLFIEVESAAAIATLEGLAVARGLMLDHLDTNPITAQPAGDELWLQMRLTESSDLTTLQTLELVFSEDGVIRAFPEYRGLLIS